MVAAGCADDAFVELDSGTFDAAMDGAPGDAAPDTRPVLDSGTPPEDVDGFIEYQMAVGGIPGLAASIVTPEGIVWSGYYGYADIETERLVDESTLFIVASVSKTVTTLGMMQLVDEGLLDLDAAADDYLPYALRNPDYAAADVTTRMLLTHTSGLFDDFVTLAEVTYTGDPTVSLGAFAEGYVTPGGEFYTDNNWATRPGSSYAYCNAGFGVVGHVIESVRGEDFRDAIQTRIFDPLGMTESGWFLSEVSLDTLASIYTWDGRTNTALPQNGFAYYPASSLRTSVPELSRFLTATIRDGELDGVRVLSAELAQAMREPQRLDINPNQTITWRFRQIGGERWLAHTGSTYGASAIIAYRPQEPIGMIVLTNSDAYVRGRLGVTGSQDALEAIHDRIAEESMLYR